MNKLYKHHVAVYRHYAIKYASKVASGLYDAKREFYFRQVAKYRALIVGRGFYSSGLGKRIERVERIGVR